MLDADAGGNSDPDLLRLFSGTNCQRTSREICTIVPTTNTQRESQFSWAICQIFDTAGTRAASPLHPWNSFQRLHGPDQNASRTAFRFGHHIQALVHAVDEIHVGMAGRAEHHAGARCNTAPGVRSAILQTQVGFGFDNAAGSGPVDQDGAQQCPCDVRRGPVIEGARKRRGHAYISTLPLKTMSLSLNFFLIGVLSNLVENSTSLSSTVNCEVLGNRKLTVAAPRPPLI